MAVVQPIEPRRIEFETPDGAWHSGAIVESQDAFWRVNADPPFGGQWTVWKANKGAHRLLVAEDSYLISGDAT